MSQLKTQREACPNVQCVDFAEPSRGNVRFQSRYGSGRWALYRCTTCRHTFSERRGSPFFRLQLHELTALEALERMAKGATLRRVAAELRIDKNTVMKVVQSAARQPRWFQIVLPRVYRWGSDRTDALYEYLRQRQRKVPRRRPTT